MTATAEPKWLQIARADMDAGVKEIAGKRGHPRIIEYYDTAGLAHDGDDVEAWCGCMAGTCLKEAGYPVPPDFYGAKQFETYGVKVDKASWQVGDIGVFYRSKLREKTWMRHVGFIVGRTKTSWKVLGGNQGDAVSIVTISDKDMSALRRPVAATVKDLRVAGSTEIKAADNINIVTTATAGLSVAGAIAKISTDAPSVPDVAALKEAVDYTQTSEKLLEASHGIAKLVAAAPWLAGATVVCIVGYLIARRIKQNRLNRHKQGAVISAHAEQAAG